MCLLSLQSRSSSDDLIRQDSALRPRIWKILLQVAEVNAAEYLRYVSLGPCEVREKIRNDTFRYLFHFVFKQVADRTR